MHDIDGSSSERPSEPAHSFRHGLRRLRLLATCEAATLVLLVVIAVPLKHFFNVPEAVALMGPVHGACFVLYAAALCEAVGSTELRPRTAILCLINSFIPVAGLVLSARLLRAHPVD